MWLDVSCQREYKEHNLGVRVMGCFLSSSGMR